jgi:hypothetical protein
MPEPLTLLALRAWHGKPEVQSVALLLLRDLAKHHPREVAHPGCGAAALLIALQSSPVPDIATFALETISSIAFLPAVVEERILQVLLLSDMLSALHVLP